MVEKVLLEILLKELSKSFDYDWVFADGSIVKAHQHSAGTATPNSECIGKSRGGNSTKIYLVVDSGGLPIHFELSEDQRNDIVRVENLIHHIKVVKPLYQSEIIDKISIKKAWIGASTSLDTWLKKFS
ncbi:hypothetical protein KW409_16365 [Vibrio fluvialis]|nr:hypothetical protein [Vibrio fluvialis]